MIPENHDVNARKAIKSFKNKYWSTKTEELKHLCNDTEKIWLDVLTNLRAQVLTRGLTIYLLPQSQIECF